MGAARGGWGMVRPPPRPPISPGFLPKALMSGSEMQEQGSVPGHSVVGHSALAWSNANDHIWRVSHCLGRWGLKGRHRREVVLIHVRAAVAGGCIVS